MPEAAGSCLCGSISFSVIGPLRPVLHCHCINCQKSSGNYVAASGCATADLTTTDPDNNLWWYDLGYCRYGFCGTCGSRMFWQGADHTDRISIQAGVLDDVSELELAGIWFANDAQPHVLLDDRVPQYVGNDNENP